MRSLLKLSAFILFVAGITAASPMQSCSTPENPYPLNSPNAYTQFRVPCTLYTPPIGAINYWFDIDDTSNRGSPNSFKLSFDPDSPSSQAASAQAYLDGNYEPVGSPTRTGDVNGVLPNLIFDNGTNTNSYVQNKLNSFGTTTLWFSFYGLALSAPDGNPGTTFTFSLPGENIEPALTIHVNGDGSTTATDYVGGTILGFFPGVYPPLSSIPEPTSFALMLLPLLVIGARIMCTSPLSVRTRIARQ